MLGTTVSIVAVAAIFFAAGYFFGFRRRTNGTGDSHGPKILLSSSIRPYDRNAYRFDGLAFPQYKITYADDDGVITERDIYVDTWRESGAVIYYTCWCFLRDERRTFRSDRILKTVNAQTGRQIKDISAYILRG